MLELKIIGALAAVQKGAIKLSLKTLSLRQRRAVKKFKAAQEQSARLVDAADFMVLQSKSFLQAADRALADTTLEINKAENVILNLQDDLADLDLED